jgi:glycosyltransferase involved in cell wall biosynthesis
MDDEPAAALPEVTIIVPARNEEACLGDCLASLVAQTGVEFEIIVVDDGSTDRTHEIAEGFPRVQVISAELLPEGSTGKNNAVVTGAKQARGRWLLFTDADTVHLPGSLARAMAEAKREGADLLSYSPEQIAVTLAEKVLMPMVFAELAAQYPPEKVRQPDSGVVAANGQYLLVRRLVYESVGGHRAVADQILEDVALARRFRAAGKRIYFRYSGDAVRARMYRGWDEMRQGWTKNLALLFPRPVARAVLLTAWWAIAWLTLPLLIPSLLLFRRIRRANFSPEASLAALAFGPPVFAYLLLRSRAAHTAGRVSWKGRTYVCDTATATAISRAELLEKSVPVSREKERCLNTATIEH